MLATVCLCQMDGALLRGALLPEQCLAKNSLFSWQSIDQDKAYTSRQRLLASAEGCGSLYCPRVLFCLVCLVLSVSTLAIVRIVRHVDGSELVSPLPDFSCNKYTSLLIASAWTGCFVLE